MARATDRRRRRRACSGVRKRGGSCWSGTEKSSRYGFRQPHAEKPEKVENRIAKKTLGGAIVVRVSLSPEHNRAAQELRSESERRDPISRAGMPEHIGKRSDQREQRRID